MVDTALALFKIIKLRGWRCTIWRIRLIPPAIIFKSSRELLLYFRGFQGNFLSCYGMTLWFCLSLLFNVREDIDWRQLEMKSKWKVSFRVCMLLTSVIHGNLPGNTILNAIISIGNRNPPTFGLILTITTWLRIYKLTTGSCNVRHAIGTNYWEDRE